MPFANQPIGGTTLVRRSIKSPNYVPAVSGWSVNKDGTAEFSGLVLRGTFNGTDFILNNAGLFLYSGTPAAGNLIASVAAVAGTDSLTNPYLAGITTYSPVSGQPTAFAQLFDAVLSLGGQSQPGTSGGLAGSNANGGLFLGSGIAGVGDLGVSLSAVSKNFLSLGITEAIIISSGLALATPQSGRIFQVQGNATLGTVFAWQPGSGFSVEETWHSLGTLAGYAVGVASYRLTPDGELEIDMSITGGGANAASVAFSVTLPAAYRPINNKNVMLSGNRVVTAGDPMPRVIISTAGTVTVDTAANNAGVWTGTGRVPLNL